MKISLWPRIAASIPIITIIVVCCGGILFTCSNYYIISNITVLIIELSHNNIICNFVAYVCTCRSKLDRSVELQYKRSNMWCSGRMM